MADQTEFPPDVEFLLSHMASWLRVSDVDESARALELLIACEASLISTDWDNWNGGTEVWTLFLSVEFNEFFSLEESQIRSLEEVLTKSAQPFLPDIGHWLSVRLRSSAAEADPDWRTHALQHLKGAEISNQGRVRSTNVASLEVDGLRFRSEPEILLYQALRKRGITFAPLPVFIRGGLNYRRVEPDFVLIKQGIMLVVELDGPSTHRETPAQASARLRMFTTEGAREQRYETSECDTEERANELAEKLDLLILKLSSQR